MADIRLTKGQNLFCSAGSITITSFLGSGGQGEVYKVILNGNEYALKLYFSRNCSKQGKNILCDIIDNPIVSKSFVWPLYFVEEGDRYGYVMNLIPEEYKDITAWLSGKVDTTIEHLLLACINLCDAFHDLQAEGYSYKDISDANVMFNPNTGDVLILDTDNITPNLKSSGVKGTPRFMAPELVEGMAKTPTRLTENHSLAVLLFEMLICEHPLEGNFQGKNETFFSTDEEWGKFVYGYNACFIFKDANCLERYVDKNLPEHANAIDMWKLYPQIIRNLFIRAFTEGLKNPHRRPMTNEWTAAFVEALGMRYTCPHCGMPIFFNRDEFRRNQGLSYCPKCKKVIALPVIKTAEEKFIMINDDDILYSSYFNLSGSKIQTVLRAEFRNGKLRFYNCSDYNIVYRCQKIGKGEHTSFIVSGDRMSVAGKDCQIVIP